MVSAKLLNRRELASLLNIKPATLASWLRLGRYGLPAIRVGRCVRYRPEDVERFLNERTVRHGEPMAESANT